MKNAVNLKRFEDLLLALQAETLGVADLVEGSARPVTLDQNSVGRLSRMDAIQGQALAQATVERQQQLLNKIEAALERIDSGDYGLCLACDQPIAEPRLAADLTAEFCIDCAKMHERKA